MFFNPYWDAVQLLPNTQANSSPIKQFVPLAVDWKKLLDPDNTEVYDHRSSLCDMYSWAIPAPKALDWFASNAQAVSLGKVLEIGAGTGYWARMLSEAGLLVQAFDVAPPVASKSDMPGNNWHSFKEELFFPVEFGGVEKVNSFSSSLFICWPPHATSFAFDLLRKFTGEYVFYCGEFYGCTADEAFFELLDSSFSHVSTCLEHVSWQGVHDSLMLFKRK